MWGPWERSHQEKVGKGGPLNLPPRWIQAKMDRSEVKPGSNQRSNRSSCSAEVIIVNPSSSVRRERCRWRALKLWVSIFILDQKDNFFEVEVLRKDSLGYSLEFRDQEEVNEIKRSRNLREFWAQPRADNIHQSSGFKSLLSRLTSECFLLT